MHNATTPLVSILMIKREFFSFMGKIDVLSYYSYLHLFQVLENETSHLTLTWTSYEMYY